MKVNVSYENLFSYFIEILPIMDLVYKEIP